MLGIRQPKVGTLSCFVHPVPCFCLATVGTSVQLSGLLPHWVSVTYLGIALGFAVKGHRVHRTGPGVGCGEWVTAAVLVPWDS